MSIVATLNSCLTSQIGTIADVPSLCVTSSSGDYEYTNDSTDDDDAATSATDDENLNGVAQQQQQQTWYYEFQNMKRIHNKYDRSEWKIALEPMVLNRCTIDDWFHFFLSDDACHSIKDYQTKEIGDTNVNVDLWRTTVTNAKNNSNTKDNNNNELERDITFLHKISGVNSTLKMMRGPTEAETFRRQRWNRYGEHGAILKTTTKVVGKSVPMGDCFRVEDEWILEQQQQQKQNNDDEEDFCYDCDSTTLTLSVKFRIVFTKRSMFQSVITNKVVAQTKRWFDGYEKMMKTVLLSSSKRK